MMRARCTSMVRGLMPSWRPASLLDWPPEIRLSTSRSRGVRFSEPGMSTVSSVAARASARAPLAPSAASTRRTIVSGSKGFSMKSSAPCLMASTAIGMSAEPEIMITGAPPPRPFSSFSTSRPERPGISTSRRTQAGASDGPVSRKRSPLSKVSTEKPFASNTADSTSRMTSSSSTTHTIPPWTCSADIYAPPRVETPAVCPHGAPPLREPAKQGKGLLCHLHIFRRRCGAKSTGSLHELAARVVDMTHIATVTIGCATPRLFQPRSPRRLRAGRRRRESGAPPQGGQRQRGSPRPASRRASGPRAPRPRASPPA